jgi:hypothetical protein
MPSLPFITPGAVIPTSPVTLPGIGLGAINATSESLLRKYINKIFKGKGWDALIAGLATADVYNRQLILNALDQLFLATASDHYLDERAADVGITRPSVYLGVDDELFRKLVIKITASKVTYHAVETVLETFYGTKDTHASVLNTSIAPYALSGGETLEVQIDGTLITVLFEADDFRVPGTASSIEVAAVITRFLTNVSPYGVALVEGDTTNGEYIRIIDSTFGFKGKVAVIGGTANAVLNFPTSVQTLYNNPNSSFYSKVPDGLDVILPVTSSIVQRDLDSASYLHGNDPQLVSTVVRDATGLCMAQVVDVNNNPLPHGLTNNSWVYMDELKGVQVPTVNDCVQYVNGVVNFSSASGILMDNGQILIANANGTLVAYTFDPSTLIYTTIASTNAPHVNGAFVRLSSTQYMLMGGNTDACEIYDSDLNIWTSASNLPAVTANPFGVMLSDGRVFAMDVAADPYLYTVSTDTWVTGTLSTYGYATFPTIVLLPNDRILITGSTVHLHTEIYDPHLDSWKVVGDTTNMLYGGGNSYVPCGPSGRVYKFGGRDAFGYSTVIEIFDIATERWSVAPATLSVARYVPAARLMSDNTILVVGGAFVTKAEVFDVKSGTCHNTFTDPLLSTGKNVAITLGDWTTFFVGGSNSPFSYIDQRVAVTTAPGFNGLFQITVPAVPAPTTFSYVTPEYPISSSAVTGTVTSNTPDTLFEGPYLLDPNAGLAITDIKTLTAAVPVGTNILQVGNAVDFPDNGYVVFNFGFEEQIGPIKYVLKLSNTELLMDNSFNNNLPIGTEIRLLNQLAPWNPSATTRGFWLTASTAGRVIAEDILDQIVASGITVTKIVKYPSDRGLGNESGISPKVSDKVVVWGGNNVDEEVQSAKE